MIIPNIYGMFTNATKTYEIIFPTPTNIEMKILPIEIIVMIIINKIKPIVS
jgi:hypothetical protein